MPAKPIIARTTTLLLSAAVSMALYGCGTKSAQQEDTSTPHPIVLTKSEKDDSELEEVLVTGTAIGNSAGPARLDARSASKRASEMRRIQPSVMPAQVMSQAYDHTARQYYQPTQNTENYAHVEHNPIMRVHEDPVSTFSIDVDTGAYANVRRFLNQQQLPPQDAVRVEELINYFSYNYPEPENADTPFSVSTELTPSPWNADNWLLQVGLKGYEVPASERPSANLVFLLDVSGSMNSPDKLPLLKQSFKLLTKQLNEQDRISIVVYAGASGVVLEPTPGDDHRTIMKALRKLQAGGSTNGAAGIELAYELAEEAFIEDGINRIVLATDGDFNVGTVDFEGLKDLAERKRKSGVALTTLGFGTGNYNDHLMEQLADAGNGNYAYIDSQREARKVLVNEVTSTLHTIAKDVKIQIEFNPEVVAEYRLIGYENRMLKREDFTNDKVDAGEIGAGHTVTALYELVPVGSDTRSVIPLRYQTEQENAVVQQRDRSASSEAAFVRLRYKQPDGDSSTEVSTPIYSENLRSLDQSSANVRFGAAVAAFGQILNGGTYLQDYTMNDVLSLATDALGSDPHGYRREFLDLVSTADMLMEENTPDHVAQTD